eukprot:1158487-Pelagomonas_calceolata.AAC.11
MMHSQVSQRWLGCQCPTCGLTQQEGGSFVGSALGAWLTNALGVTSDDFTNLFTLVSGGLLGQGVGWEWMAGMQICKVGSAQQALLECGYVSPLSPSLS